MENEKDLATRVAEKKQEIENYKGILARYGSGRWLSQGRRHLEELEHELITLESQWPLPS